MEKEMNMKVRIHLFVLVACMLLVFGATAFAEKPLTPETISGVTVVDDDWVKANMKNYHVFDVRMKAEYVEGHLPGAQWVYYHEKSEKSPDFDASLDSFKIEKFPSDKSTPLIVYCNGPRCWKSYKASVELKRAGYTNIHWYRNGGFPGWKAKGFPVESK
jgi:rhodanese-related sulfurtransferase